MRVALMSDVHANLAALDAVLAHAAGQRFEAAWHMGDLVGYGPDPNDVVARMTEIGAECVLGNHDAAAIGVIDTSRFNAVAAAAAEWTARTLLPEIVATIATFPSVATDGLCTRTHGTLRDPLWEYLSTWESAYAQFARQETPLSATGHTHVPLLVRDTPEGGTLASADDGAIEDLAGGRWCINPGSVGQPRDGDPRACYAILDTTEMTIAFFRVPYPIAETQRKMTLAKLPLPLIERLAAGL